MIGQSSSAVTLICTLKNEEHTIRDFLSSIEKQSRKPDEIIVADGGSTDNTVEILKSFAKFTAIETKIIVARSANIAAGRNIAIGASKNEIIACSDAGCTLDGEWLENIVKPLETDSTVDVVSGWYEPDSRSTFEKIASKFMFPNINKIKRKSEKFLPSSRSIAFRKKSWIDVGGYPEWLETAEDTYFDMKLYQKGFKFYFAEDAVVYWRVRSNIKSIYKQFFRYGQGDGRARIFFQNGKAALFSIYLSGICLCISSLMFPYLALLIVIGIFTYYFLPAIRYSYELRDIRALMWAPILRLIVDISGISGYIDGRINMDNRNISDAKKRENTG